MKLAPYNLGGLAGANYAKAFSKAVGVGKMYLQSEADAYRARAAKVGMTAEDIARREFNAGRALSDAELTGVKPAAPAPVSAPGGAPVAPVPVPVPAPSAPTTAYQDTLNKILASVGSTPIAAPQVPEAPLPVSLPPIPRAEGSTSSTPLVIPITYTPSAPASVESAAPDTTASVTTAPDYMRYLPFIGLGLLAFKLLAPKKRRG